MNVSFETLFWADNLGMAGFVVRQIFMILSSVLMMRCVRLFLPGKKGALWAGPYFLLYAVISLPVWVGDENLLLCFPFFIGVFLLCFRGTRLARLVTGALFYTLLMPVCTMVDTSRLFRFVPQFWDTGQILLKAVVWISLALLIRKWLPVDTVNLSRRLWLITGALLLAPLFGMLSFSIMGKKWGYIRYDFDWVMDSLAYTILPFVMLSAAAVLFVVILFSRSEALEREQQLAELREVYYQGLKQEQGQVRSLRHDMRNHLSVLRGLLEQGSTSRALDYMDELAESPALRGMPRLCENETANAVLASKAASMEQSGLTVDFGVSLPEELCVSGPDLAALLGNALDNAIEAARQAQDKRITVRARADKGLLMLRVVNAYEGKRNIENGAFKTTKEDKKTHGFGLYGMKEIAKRYGGTLEVVAEDGQFELVVCLPLVQG